MTKDLILKDINKLCKKHNIVGLVAVTPMGVIQLNRGRLSLLQLFDHVETLKTRFEMDRRVQAQNIVLITPQNKKEKTRNYIG